MTTPTTATTTTTTTTTTPRLLLQLSLPHDWDQIDPVRQAVALCVGAVFGPALKEAISMVSSELLENAIKHGKPGTTVRLAITEQDNADISVVVTNTPIGASSSAALEERIEWLRGFKDPSEAYVAAMQRALEEMSEGGLGLPRIAHEGGCAVSCDTSAPGAISVEARLSSSHPAAYQS